MALQVLLVVVSSLSLACGQLGLLTGPVRPYPAITGAQARALELFQNPELRDLAAERNERIFIEIDGPESTAIVEEGVNVNMDCFPWLSRFPGGTVEWLLQERDENGRVTGPPAVVMPTPPNALLTTPTVVGGEFIRWFNITSASIVQGAEDPSFGNYICSVCIARGTRFQQCHNATLTLHILGAPPCLNKATDNDPEIGLRGELQFNIAADFCLDVSMIQMVILRCEIKAVDVPEVIPTPTRTWVKDGEIIYSGQGTDGFNESFLMSGDNALFTPMVVVPAPLDIMTLASVGSIQLNTEANNLSMPMLAPPGVDANSVRERTFNALLGDYMCMVSNVFGSDSATTTIRICGLEPEVPECDAETLFLEDNNEVVPAGCNVCIPSGSVVNLNCTATNGTPPLMYQWVGPNNFVSQDPIIRVSREGQYNCTVTNEDNPRGVMRTSDVFVTPRSLLTVTAVDRFGDRLSDSGCGRLLRSLDPEPDMCLLVGENLDLSCASDVPLNVTFQNGSVFSGPLVVTEDLDMMTLQCVTMTNTPCDAAPNTHTVRVFDPARVDRNQVLLSGETGAGRTTDTIMVTEGGAITLVCPTSGIDDPQTNWTRITTNSAGVAVEMPINETDTAFSVTMRDDFTLVLTITGYTGNRHNGIYACRTDNIAGRDSALVALSSTPDTGVWVTGDYTDCNVDCNEGRRVRSVTCRSLRDGRLLPNDRCTDERPPSERDCSDLFTNDCFLTPIFVTGNYGPCSQGCEGGFRQRDVTCTVPMTGEQLRDADCFPLRKPRETESCQNTCCIDDTYSTCKRIGSALCNLNAYQQKCCWTCLLRVKPY